MVRGVLKPCSRVFVGWFAVASTTAPLATSALGQSCQGYWTRPLGTPASSFSIQRANVFDDGTGPALFIQTFRFPIPPGGNVCVVKYSSAGWQSVASGAPTPQIGASGNTTVPAGYQVEPLYLGALKIGSSSSLFLATLDWSAAPPTPWGGRWTGSLWAPPPAGLLPQSINDVIPRFTIDLGAGPVEWGLRQPPTGASYEFHWLNGTTWVRAGQLSDPGPSHGVAFDDGRGAAVYAYVNTWGGLVRWDGAEWTLAVPMQGGGAVSALAVWDDGRGPAIYAAGQGFYDPSVSPPEYYQGIGRWDGKKWEHLGSGLSSSGFYSITKLFVFDDGAGPALYVVGRFDNAGGQLARSIAKWDGHAWHALGAGVTGHIYDAEIYDDGRGPSIFVVGNFTAAGGGTAYRIAQWVGCPNCYADCDNNQRLDATDFICFINRYAERNPYANCTVDATIDIADFTCFQTKFAAGCGP